MVERLGWELLILGVRFHDPDFKAKRLYLVSIHLNDGERLGRMGSSPFSSLLMNLPVRAPAEQEERSDDEEPSDDGG